MPNFYGSSTTERGNAMTLKRRTVGRIAGIISLFLLGFIVFLHYGDSIMLHCIVIPNFNSDMESRIRESSTIVVTTKDSIGKVEVITHSGFEIQQLLESFDGYQRVVTPVKCSSRLEELIGKKYDIIEFGPRVLLEHKIQFNGASESSLTIERDTSGRIIIVHYMNERYYVCFEVSERFVKRLTKKM